MDRRFRPGIWAVLWLLVADAHALAQGPQGPPRYSPSAVERGSRLYAANCAVCHGANGDLVPGVDLSGGRFRHASSDEDLRRIITSGIPDTPMPANKFDPSELAELVAFIRSMRDVNAGGIVIGDVGRGRLVFETKGKCASCHRVNGNGPWVAPDLSNIGAIRTVDALQRSLLDPTPSMRPINRPVRAATRAGEVINGRRLNEDTYTVQLIDDRGRLVSLLKEDLREYTIIKTSPMPSYKDKLSSKELADLVGYLLSLKGLTEP